MKGSSVAGFVHESLNKELGNLVTGFSGSLRIGTSEKAFTHSLSEE